MALSAEDKKEVQDLITAGNTALIESEPFKKTLTDLTTSAVGQATTELTKTVTTLADSVKKIGEAAPAPGVGGKEGDKGKPDPVAEAVKSGIEAALKPINDRFAAMDAEKGKAQEKATRDALITETLGEEKYSGLAKHGTFVRGLHAMGVKTKDEVKAALKEYLAEQKALGVEIKPTSASPEAEGAKRPQGTGDGKGLTIEQQREKLREIQQRTEPRPVK